MSFVRSGVAFVAVLFAAATVQAGVMGWTINQDDAGPDTLHSIDVSTGAVSAAIGFVGFEDVEGLAYDSANGILYGVDDTTDMLITINTGTGVGSVVTTAAFVSDDSGLAFDASSGLLIVSNDLPSNTTSFHSVNPNTGIVAAIGTSSVESIDGLGFLGSTLYGVSGATDSLYTIDLGSGAATLVGALGFDVGDEVGLAGANGTIYLTDDGEDGTFDAYILSIDPSTGAATEVAQVPGVQFEGLALDNSTIPEPSTLVSLLALATFGFVSGRRRRRA